MNTNSKADAAGSREVCSRCSFDSAKLGPKDSEPFALKNRIYENTMCNSVILDSGCSGEIGTKKADSLRAACGCHSNGSSVPPKQTTSRAQNVPSTSAACDAKRRCCDIRPRSSTISGENASCRAPRSVNSSMSSSTGRVNDAGKAYRQNRCHGAPGKPCSCRSAGPQYSRMRDSAYRQPPSVSERECHCAACKAQHPREPPHRNVCLDGRIGLCNCATSGDVRKALRPSDRPGRMSILAPRSGDGCARCESFKKNHAAVDSVDGADSTLRKAAIAENILEYEISALEYGISVVEGSADLLDYGRGLYVKELKEAEPKYQNVRQYVAEEKPQYANLEEMTRLYGDRLGPEGQNSEDEVYYENVTSVRNSLRGCRDQNAATMRILSASASSLCFHSDVNFYSGSHSGTFPQYLQKEMRGFAGVTLSRSHSDKGVVYAVDERSSAVMEIAKKEMCDVKQQRLLLAQDEYKHLSSTLTALATSRTSLCSTGSGSSGRYDPDLLRSDVALAKDRVAMLRRELRQAKAELSCTQQGVDTLHSVEQKMSNQQGCYNIIEAQAVMTELRNIQKSLTSGEKEKAELMQSLSKLKDDLTRLQLGEVSPSASTLSIPQEKLSTASQTELCADSVPIGTRLAEMARMRLQYDESRKRVKRIQQQLADLEEKVQPGQAESDKDRLLLFQEKEQLLRELRSITPRTKSAQEMNNIQLKCKRLEQDLNNALEMSNRCITDRLRLHEEKQLLLQQLSDALRSMTMLESQLKSLSASTLSVSSSSSLGSLSTTSSKGSLSSGLSFTDIYGGTQCIINPLTVDKPIDMVDLQRRVARLLQSSGSASPHSSLGSPPVSPPAPLPPPPPPAAPPPYSIACLTDILEVLCTGGQLDREPLLSPISETPPRPDSSGTLSYCTNSRSVSAAVSDESVAGDSGVFEASCRPRDAQPSSSVELSAQVQIKLQYSTEEQTLYVGVQKLRNLQALSIKEEESVYIRAVLLPAVREAGAPLPAPLRLPLPLPFPLLRHQTLRLQACRRQHCLGFAQVSLADFAGDAVSVRWYNILTLQAETAADSHREESSDESTLIPSQTSTLTRNQGGGEELCDIAPAESPVSSDDEDDCEGDGVEEEDDALLLHQYPPITHQLMEEDEEQEYQEGEEGEEAEEAGAPPRTEEKETNTECCIVCPESADDRLAIKRSQTFSPTPQLAKTHYICRLNRSESDSSMPLYRRAGAAAPGAAFDRHAAARRSLRWGRAGGVPPPPTPRARAPPAPRTSLDLELDLRAQHTRLSTLQTEIKGLKELKQRLEVAKSQGDTAVATWAAEDTALAGLCARAQVGEGDRRTARAVQKVRKDLFRLRRTKAPRGRPDIITFREKMVFFTHHQSSVPVLPSDEDVPAIHSPPGGGEGYRVRRSGRCQDVLGQGQEQGPPSAPPPPPSPPPPDLHYVLDRVLGVQV